MDRLSSKHLVDDCFRPGQPRLSHDEVIALLRSRVSPVSLRGQIPLLEAAGRILSASVHARHPVPGHTNAAVDGFAFAATAEIRSNGATLPVHGRASAGHPLGQPLPAGSAVRILTGAVMPDGLDTVVMQEDVILFQAEGSDATMVRIPAGLKLGANVRKAGEDVAAGAQLFARGDTLRPQDLAALASIGQASVACYDRLRVAIVSTGDEVIPVARGPLAPGQVYDANTPMLSALATLTGASVTTLGIWPDKLDVVTANLAAACEHYDVILTSGGASLGEEDHMAKAISALGIRHLWQIAIKPGRPMMFGQIRTRQPDKRGDTGAGTSMPEPGASSSDTGEAPTRGTTTDVSRDTVVVGLPGNPVAVFVCFLMYVAPLLKALGGGHWPEPRRFMVPANFAFTGRKQGRREFWRGRLIETPMGLAAEKFARDGSGLISGLTWSDGLIDIPEDTGDITPGTPVAFIPYASFGIV